MIKPGMIIGERYEIIDKVGSGGMADVYKALCHKLNRYVAIKILKQEFSTDESFVDKFRAEAQSAAGLCHPNIVNVYDVGEENGIYYIVMELIEGITLKNFIERKGRLDIREATGIAIQIAQGLEAAHANNIIHRDIKPQNIIISREGKVKVADFGIAKAASSNTLTSSAMGSVHYISPEQARGGYSDEKSDIYSLGITIYEMILGRVPFEGDNAVSIALLHIQEEPRTLGELLPGIPISIDKIVQKCLQKKPERRYLSVVELIEDLKHSLIEPDVDFVVIPDVLNNSPTIALSPDDVNAIRNGALQSEMSNMAMMNNNMDNMNDMNNGMQPNMGYDGYDDNYNSQQMYPDSTSMSNFNDFDDDYVDEDEEKVDNKLEKITIIGAIVIVIFIIGIIIAIVAGDIGKKDKKTEETPTPTVESDANIDGAIIENVVNMTEEDAKKTLEEQGFTNIEVVKVNYGNIEGVTDGSVVIQDPAQSSEKVPFSQKITLYVQDKTQKQEEVKLEEAVIPSSIKGMTEEQAKSLLKNLFKDTTNFNVEAMPDYNDSSVDIGKVTKTSPSIGTKIKNVGTVYIYIRTEQDQVDVPDVVGMSLEDAKSTIRAKGLKCKVSSEKQTTTNSSNHNKVYKQSPTSDNGNRKIEKNGEITIYLYEYKEEPKIETPEPEEEKNNYNVRCTLNLNRIDGMDEALKVDDVPGDGRFILITAKVGSTVYYNNQHSVSKNTHNIDFQFNVTNYDGDLEEEDIDITYEVRNINVSSFSYSSDNTSVRINPY